MSEEGAAIGTTMSLSSFLGEDSSSLLEPNSVQFKSMRLYLRIDFDETKVPVSYASVQSGVANLSARRRRHPNKKVFRPT